jgi:hypothetical protein
MMRQSPNVPLNILIDEKTAATQLSISLHTLRHWRRQGRGPQYVKLGSAIRTGHGISSAGSKNVRSLKPAGDQT